MIYNKKREYELYNKAVSRYLDKTDWDISDWLSDEEYSEYLDCYNNSIRKEGNGNE